MSPSLEVINVSTKCQATHKCAHKNAWTGQSDMLHRLPNIGEDTSVSI